MTTSFLAESLLVEALEGYNWPIPFELEDEMPDGFNVAFPESNFFFVEGQEGRISVEFLPEDTGEQYMTFTIQDALEMVAPEVDTRGYDFFHLPGPHSREKVKAGIERCCGLIHEHLLSVVKGDFSWVEEAKQRRIIPPDPKDKV